MSVRNIWQRLAASLGGCALLIPLALACSSDPAATMTGMVQGPTPTSMGTTPQTAMPTMQPAKATPPGAVMMPPKGMTPAAVMATGGAPAMPPVMAPPMDAMMGGMPGTPATDMQTVVPDPSWTCAMPEGIPPPEMGKMVMEVEFMLGEVYDIGDTQFGHRVLTEIKGGTAKGPMIDATFMSRGIDWQLTLPTGSVEVEQVNIFRANGGTVYFRNCGVSPMGSEKVRIVPDFEAPTGGALAFLNDGKFAGYREFDAAKKTMKMTVYDIAGVTAPADKVTIVDPKELPNQTWECKTAMGTRGGVLYNESVGIEAGSVMVGQSKRGSRNIIPITGGTTNGKLMGGVLDGGADFQLTGNAGFILDARYTLKTSDDELIIVRNCGAASGLIPVFEARSDGPYAFVNKGNYFSTTPSPTGCCVNITIYEGQ